MATSAADGGAFVAIELSDWEIRSLSENLQKRVQDGLPEATEQTPTIFRAPPHLREVDKAAYEPKVISIGPYHRSGKAEFKDTELLKLRYLGQFLNLSQSLNLEFYLKKMNQLENKARHCYSEPISMNSKEFVEMLLLDGCFIVNLLLMLSGYPLPTFDCGQDPTRETPWALGRIIYDLLLLENQIPFFILQNLYDGVKNTDMPELSDLVIHFEKRISIKNLPSLSTQTQANPDERCMPWLTVMSFFGFRSGKATTESEKGGSTEEYSRSAGPQHEEWGEPFHLLHLFHSHIKPPRKVEQPHAKTERICPLWPTVTSFLRSRSGKAGTTSQSGSNNGSTARSRNADSRSEPKKEESLPQSIPTATKLRAAGIKFRNSEKHGPLEASFRNGVIEMPLLGIYDHTFPLLRNLVAFEQCRWGFGMHVTNYACFMDDLVDNQADVAMLQREGVIMNGIGSEEELADLFNKLCKKVVFYHQDSHLSSLLIEVNKYYNSRWPRWRAKLVREHLGNPWAIISIVAAAILLLLTIAQTGFAVLSYVRPPLS